MRFGANADGERREEVYPKSVALSFLGFVYIDEQISRQAGEKSTQAIDNGNADHSRLIVRKFGKGAFVHSRFPKDIVVGYPSMFTPSLLSH